MEQQSFPVSRWLTFISDDLLIANANLQTWLTIHALASKKVAEKILTLFNEEEKVLRLLHLPATLINTESGHLYLRIGLEEYFPKNMTLIECIILTGIIRATGHKNRSTPDWAEVLVKMEDVKTILKPGENFSKECEKIIERTSGLVRIRPHNKANDNKAFVFSVFFDFMKDVPIRMEILL